MKRQVFWILLIIFSISVFSCSLDKNIVTPPSSKSTTPNTPSPKNGASNKKNFQHLTWECGGASSYSVYFGKDKSLIGNNRTLIKSKISEKYADVIASENGKIYYWQVVAHLSDGTDKKGPIWFFTTKTSTTTVPGYVITKHSLTTEAPNKVKMLFQVLDLENKGIDFLGVDDFEIIEDGEHVAPTESNLKISKRQNNPYHIKTVLMLDNSTSITDDPEHTNNMELLKESAKSFVNNMSAQQEIAVFKFSSSAEKLVDFTSDRSKLIRAIDNIGRGHATTNLYGAVIDGVSEWTDLINVNNITKGQMVLFTDGNDTQESHTLGEALDAVGDKNVYTVGLGSEIKPEVLEQIGNQGAFTIAEMSELNQIFIQIQLEINAYANSFYWMEYSSPKRGTKEHTLILSIKNNPLSGSVVEGTFNSAGFFDPISGVYFNSSFSNPNGTNKFPLVAGGNPVHITVSTFGGTDEPNYSWGSDTSLVITKKDMPINSEVEVYAKSSAPAGDIQISVNDYKNGFSKKLTFNISR